MTTPCKNCKDRHQGCHSECEHYKEWSKVRDKVRAERMKEAETTDFILHSKPPRRIK